MSGGTGLWAARFGREGGAFPALGRTSFPPGTRNGCFRGLTEPELLQHPQEKWVGRNMENPEDPPGTCPALAGGGMSGPGLLRAKCRA